MSTVFDIGLMVKASFRPVGAISFEASGAEAEKSQKAWDEVAAQDVPAVRRSRRERNSDGNTVMKFVGVNVERASEDYPQVAIEYLSNKYGYFGKPAK